MAHRPCQPLIFFSPFPRTNVAHHYPPCCTQYHPFASRCGSHKPPKSTSNPLDTCPSATPQSCSRTFHGWEYLSISSARLGERLYLSTSSNDCSYPNDFAKTDIRLALSKGIDAFALNVGSDPWQPDRVADAYRAAKAVSNSNNLLGHLSQPFKLFLSFDMSAIPCASASDSNLIRHYVDTYHAHPNQLIYAGQPFYSTFAGEGCTFGARDLNEGWMNVMKKNPVTGTHFVPSFFMDPASFHNVTAMDGAFSVSPSLRIKDFSRLTCC